MKNNLIRLFGHMERRLALVEDIDTNTSADYDGKDTPVLPINYQVEVGEANLVTSYADRRAERYHYPVLDLDYRVEVVQSTSTGHCHLYINKLVAWDKYVAVLDAMADAGLLERGYVSASKKRGHTAVRLPWVRKGAWKKVS